jgi:hypothetical protein
MVLTALNGIVIQKHYKIEEIFPGGDYRVKIKKSCGIIQIYFKMLSRI